MNYYNPYFLNSNTGLFSKLFGNLKLGNILNGANKTLNFVNQTIPLVKQISPMVKNVKTMFNVINEFKKVDENKIVKNEVKQTKPINTNKPTFFIN